MSATLHNADRHLLFGILAFQLQFITKEDLVAGMSAWVQDKSKSLGELLVQRRAISAEQNQLLDALVNEHVAKHGGDVQKSIEQISTIDQQATLQLAEIGDPHLTASLTWATRSSNGTSSSSTASSPVDTNAKLVSRFRIIRPHRRGGLGEVFVAEDRELSRQVALKEIQSSYADNLDSRQRFMREAEITGRLEHPGIVPVYGLGTYADGRPYYAMRFVRGDSLLDAIEKFHAQTGSMRGASYLNGSMAMAYRDLLRRFIDVCNAIHYAHSRGVLHRDLKPGNIMLGEYGETLVVDWGLAKVVSGPPSELEPERVGMQSPSGSQSTPTMLGSAIGTPRYMSPEQAAGRIEILGPATDIYSLGATLYHLLVGQPPFGTERNVSLLLDAVQKGSFVSPSKVNAFVDSSIESVCFKAMAVVPQARYANAKELADDIEKYLADEQVSTSRETRLLRARRWMRHHPALATGGMITLLFGVVSASIIAALIASNSRVLSQKNKELVVATTEAKKAATEALNSLAVAEEARDEAENISDFMIRAFRRSDPEIDGTKVTVAEVLLQAEQAALEQTDLKVPVKAGILDAIGESLSGLGQYKDAVRVFQAVRTLRIQENGPDDLQTLGAQVSLASDLGASGQKEEAVKLYEDTLARYKKTHGLEHDATRGCQNGLAVLYKQTGRLDLAIPLYEEVWESSKKFAPEAPSTFLCQLNLAVAYQANNQNDLAIPMLEQAVAGMEKATPDSMKVLVAQNNLAYVYSQTANHGKALEIYEKVLQARTSKLGPKHPDTLLSQMNLGATLIKVDRIDEAISLFISADEGMSAVLGENHPSTLMAKINLAGAYESKKNFELSLPIRESIYRLQSEALGADASATLSALGKVAFVHWNQKQFDKSIPLYRKQLEMYEAKSGANSKDAVSAKINLGVNLKDAGQLQESLAILESAYSTAKSQSFASFEFAAETLVEVFLATQQGAKAIPIIRDLVELDRSQNAANSVELATSLSNRSELFLTASAWEEAEKILSEALATQSEVEPDKWTTSHTQFKLGQALYKQNKLDPAALNIEQAFEGLRKCPLDVSRDELIRILDLLKGIARAREKPEELERWTHEQESLKAQP